MADIMREGLISRAARTIYSEAAAAPVLVSDADCWNIAEERDTVGSVVGVIAYFLPL